MHPTKEKPRITKENIVRLTMHSIQESRGTPKNSKGKCNCSYVMPVTMLEKARRDVALQLR